MRSYTEQELLGNQAKYLFRIKNLVKNKRVPIEDIGECLNYNLHLNYRTSFKMDYLNEYGTNTLEQSLEIIRYRGLELMEKLIEPKSMKDSMELVRGYNNLNDEQQYFSFYQNKRDRVETDYQW